MEKLFNWENDMCRGSKKAKVFEEESKSFWKQEDTVEYKFEAGCGSNCGP